MFVQPEQKQHWKTKVETRLPSARIAPNPMLIAGGKAWAVTDKPLTGCIKNPKAA